MINVVFCHGIGTQKPSYARETISLLSKELGRTAQCINWHTVHWGDVLDGRQNLITNRSISSGDVDWQDLRREYVIGGLGDACAYLGSGRGASPYFHKIQARVGKKLDSLLDYPTVVIAHSMGCTVMMDYLYDHPLLKTQCAILFGCNLPLFWLGHRPGHLPLPKIDRVYNLYDSDDLLAYPLKNISDQTRRWVTGDYRISTGTVMGAHTGYWTDPDFIEWVAKCLTRELRAS